MWSFIIIAIGAVSCALGGHLAKKITSSRVAAYALLGSGICCALSPLSFSLNIAFFISFLIVWGILVIADSPQFSTVVAYFAPKESTGTALTIVNCIGFSITVASIQLINCLLTLWDIRFIFIILAIGPAFGLISFYRTAAKATV